MKTRKLRYWSLVLLGLLGAVFMPAAEVLARGGRGGGGRGGGARGGNTGGRGGRGSGAAGRAAAAASRGGGRGAGGRNNERKEEEKIARREARMERVAAARIVYAKRERQTMWDDESNDRFGSILRRILRSASD
ncbi:MAG: hypothetical protein ACYTGZ_03860 [Planctomycetota bacterium]|jgi:hypothetical protein